MVADEEVSTNMALMAFLDSEFNKFEFDLATYKRGLASVEEQLVFYRKNEVILDKLIRSQITDKSRKGVGFESYNAVAPPPTGLFAPPTIDLSNSGLKEFQQPEFEGYGVKANKSVSKTSSNEIKKSPDAPIIEEWVSDSDEDESEVMVSDNVQDKLEQAKQPRKIRTGQREVRPVWNNAMRTNHQNFSNSRRNFAPTVVLTKSSIVSISTARQRSSRAAAPVSAARPINTATPKPFEKRVTSVVGKQGINAVKSSACWVWRSKRNVVDHGDPQVALKDTCIFDNGCSRHMTGNKSYLTDYQDYDEGFVAFAGSSKGGKITGK
ncbi:hypothetical protein Tco_0829786, partial [Tanacetum coccineum]